MPVADPAADPDLAARINAFDLAALVYDDGIAIDRLMVDFAHTLTQAGRRVGGIAQLPPGPATEPGQVDLIDLMSGEIRPLKQRLGPGAASCTLDGGALAAASTGIRRAVAARVDLVVISKFSKQEIAGGGFRAEFAAAVEAGLPVLTSVKRSQIGGWLAFTGGLGTLLDGRMDILADWWAETGRRRA